MGVSFLMFGGWGFLRFGVRDSYVLGLVFLPLEISNYYVWGLGIFTFG